MLELKIIIGKVKQRDEKNENKQICMNEFQKNYKRKKDLILKFEEEITNTLKTYY